MDHTENLIKILIKTVDWFDFITAGYDYNLLLLHMELNGKSYDRRERRKPK